MQFAYAKQSDSRDISESCEEAAVRITGDAQPPVLDATSFSFLCSPAALHCEARTPVMSFLA